MSGTACLFDQVRRFAQQRGGQPALVMGPHQVSYSELDENSKRVCNGLLAMGLDRQSRVAILCANRTEFFEIWQGASMAGHVQTPINTRLASQEIAFIINDSQAKVLFVDENIAAQVLEVADGLTGLRHIFILGTQQGSGRGTATFGRCYFDWRQGLSADEPAVSAHPDDTVVQMYTSGTTGFPKGVELGHSGVLACVSSMMGETAWPAGEITLVTAPLFHTAGSAYAHCALQSGGTIVLLDELSPARVLEAIGEHGVNQALFVPALIRMVLDLPACRSTDFSSLQRILYGASPVPDSTLREALEVFACDFEQGYGLTESVGPVAMLRPGDHATGSKLQSCGKAVPGTEIRVVDSAGNNCAIGEVGEIIISGLQLMKAYWNRPDATNEVIRDGWLYSGDAGYFDSDGYLFIHDRLKDMIVSGGENVYPAEVENVLTTCDKVSEVAVIGVPDEQWGEAVKAIVVKTPGSDLSADDVAAFARRHIAAFKCPKTVDFVDSIPRNPAGKILKKVLREPYWADHERRVS